MLLNTIIHLSVFGLVSTSQALIKRQGHFDIKRNGDYTIVNCGDHDGARLVSLLDDLWTVLQPSLRAVSVSDVSPAFGTFFGAATLSPHVKSVLTNVTTGVSLYPPQRRFQQTGSPLLICATADGQLVGKRDGVDYYYQCLLYPYKSLIAISGTPYIVICPYFFSGEVADSPPANMCPTVDPSINRFRGTGLDFTGFKVWALLEGILRYYIYATARVSSSFAQDVNQCVRLGARQRIENPKNYVYYAASIYGLCQDFPDFHVARRRPLDNTTVSGPADSEYRSPNASSVSGFPISSQATVVDPSGSRGARSA